MLIFHVSMGPLYVLLGEMSDQVLYPFFNWIVFPIWSGVSSLYILEIRPLSEVSLANMFFHKVCSFFILMLFSLAMQKLFILMRSHLFILSFMSIALGDMSVRMLLHGMSEIFLPMFSSSACMVLRLIFVFYPPWIYLCVRCKLVIEFHLFAHSCPDLPTPFVEEAIFAPFYAPAFFVKY